MTAWLDAHVGPALWIGALALAAIAGCAVAGLIQARRRRRSRAIMVLCTVLHPIRSLCDSARDLRDAIERSDGAPRLAEVAALGDGALAQRLRDVRAASVAELASPRAVEAVYQAREAAARLMVWLERLGRNAAESRLQIQMIWKALHDAVGNLERDVAMLEVGRPGRRR